MMNTSDEYERGEQTREGRLQCLNRVSERLREVQKQKEKEKLIKHDNENYKYLYIRKP